MKKNLLVAFMLVVAGNTFAKTAADTLTVTTQPQMHCREQFHSRPARQEG